MPRRRFTDSEEQEIAKIYKAGYSARAIARAYGLNFHTAIVAALRRTKTQQRSPAERNRKYYICPYTFDNINNEEKAYWWGFLYADGSVSKRSLSVKLGRGDKEHLGKLKIFLQSEHPIKDRITRVNGKEYKATHFYATDIHLTDRLKQLGIVAGRPLFGLAITNLPEYLYSHWIRGYFDGDGSISKPSPTRPSARFCGRFDTLEWIRSALHKSVGFRFNQSIYKHQFANAFYLEYTGGKQCRRLREYLYQSTFIYLERKFARFQALKEPTPRKRDSKGRFT